MREGGGVGGGWGECVSCLVLAVLVLFLTSASYVKKAILSLVLFTERFLLTAQHVMWILNFLSLSCENERIRKTNKKYKEIVNNVYVALFPLVLWNCRTTV